MIPITRPALPPLTEYVALLERVWSSRMLSNFAEYASALEALAADYLGANCVLTVSSGDVALILSLRALQLPPKSRVLVPSFTFNSTVNAILWNDLTPVFVDIDPENLNIDPADVARRVEGVGAVLATHVFGNPAPVGELARLAGIFVRLGVEKLRITGGEPTVRRDLPDLVRQLAVIEGVRDLTLTTNGSVLRTLAAPLADAGLQRVTVSLDSLDDAVFRAMSGIDMPLARVLDGIAAARAAGLAPVKINMVVRRGVNEASIVPMARWARDAGFILRYIEYMDVGTANGWRLDDVVPGAEIIALVDAAFPLEALQPNYAGEVANRFRYRDGAGEIGVIASVTAPFCGACTRARLSAEGELFTCLFAAHGTDLRGPLRSGTDDAGLEALIRAAWSARDDRYSDLRSASTVNLPRVEMFAIGG